MNKVRGYVISSAAFLLTQDADNKGRETTIFYHHPALLFAESIEGAAEIAKLDALHRGKPEDGWFGHQVLIRPVTLDFLKLAKMTFETGYLDLESAPEEPREFKF